MTVLYSSPGQKYGDWVAKLRALLRLLDVPINDPNSLPVPMQLGLQLDVWPLVVTATIQSGTADVHAGQVQLYAVPTGYRARLRAVAKPGTAAGTPRMFIYRSSTGYSCDLTAIQAGPDIRQCDILLDQADAVYMSQGAGGDAAIAWSIAYESYPIS